MQDSYSVDSVNNILWKRRIKLLWELNMNRGCNEFWLEKKKKKKVDSVGYMMLSLVFILCTFSALLWVMSQYIFHIFLPKFVDMLDQWEVLGERQRKGEIEIVYFFLLHSFWWYLEVGTSLLLFWHLPGSPSLYLLDSWRKLHHGPGSSQTSSASGFLWHHVTVVPQCLQEIGSGTLLGYQNPRMLKSLR